MRRGNFFFPTKFFSSFVRMRVFLRVSVVLFTARTHCEVKFQIGSPPHPSPSREPSRTYIHMNSRSISLSLSRILPFIGKYLFNFRFCRENVCVIWVVDCESERASERECTFSIHTFTERIRVEKCCVCVRERVRCICSKNSRRRSGYLQSLWTGLTKYAERGRPLIEASLAI